MALADPKNIGTGATKMNGDDFHAGYYRRINKKEKRWEAVGIYPVGNVLIGKIDDRVHEGDMWQLWRSACTNPISFDLYKAYMGTRTWPDEPPLLGDNNPPDEDDPDPEFTALMREYEGEKEQILDFIKRPITSQEQADKIGIWKTRLTAIRGKAEGLHKVEKQPHLDAGRAVDNKWRTLKEEPTDIVAKAMAHLKPWMDKLKREEAERAAKAAAEAERLRVELAEKARKEREEIEERQRQADEAAAAAMAALDNAAGDPEADRKAQELMNESMAIERQNNAARSIREDADKYDQDKIRAAEEAAKVQRVSAGRTGAKVTMKKYKVGVIEDAELFAKALIALKSEALMECLQTIAQRYATGGITLDGMKIETEERPS